MNFYKRFLGDYAVDTRHLTYVEHGAYTLLLDFYYSTEQSLPKDIVKLMAPKTDEEMCALKSVLRQFFFKRNGRFHHTRCIREIRQYSLKVAAYRASGRKGGLKQKAMAKQSLSEKDEFRLENKIQSQSQSQNTQSQARKPSEVVGFVLPDGGALTRNCAPPDLSEPKGWESRTEHQRRKHGP